MSNDRESFITDVLSGARTRSQFLKGAAVAAASLGLPAAAEAAPLGGGGGRGGGMPESVSSILNIAATAEALAVTAFYNVHLSVLKGQFNVKGAKVPTSELVSIVRAILREETDHYSFLVGAGARPLLTSFTLPSDLLHSATAALKIVELLETVFVGAYMAAAREFAEGGMGTLTQYAFQIGGVEAEHRVLARAGLGEMPPNNKAFETNLYSRVAQAAAELAHLGLLKPQYGFPGVAAVNHLLATTVSKDVTAGVIQRHP